MAQNPNLKTQNAMLEEFHYYPFGMCFDVSKSPMLGKSAAVKYNSQLHDHDEFEDANGNVYGLEDYNFAFRNYDAQIGRWLQPDPLMQHPSPYLAMSNNPVSFTDPSGLWDFDGLDNGDDKPKPPMWQSKVGEIRTDGKGNSLIFDGETWRFEREVPVSSKNHFMLGSLETTSGNEAYLPNNNSGTEVSGVNGKLRRVGDAYNRGYYIENERNWAMGMNVKGAWEKSKLLLDIGGGIYGALQTTVRPGDKWLGKNGKYYNTSWGGNQYTGSRSGAFKAASNYKWAGRAVLGTSIIIGGIETVNGYQKDGGQFGYNAQSAAFGTAGSIAGGLAGAEAGAWSFGIAGGLIGGPPGAVIGAGIGGFVGGLGGGFLGGNVGGRAVNYYHGR